MAEQKRLFLLDAYTLIFRGLLRTYQKYQNNSREWTFCHNVDFMILYWRYKKWDKNRPLAVCFDKGAVRRPVTEMFAESKPIGDATPDAIKIAVPTIQNY